jgi:hypothetical protein
LPQEDLVNVQQVADASKQPSGLFSWALAKGKPQSGQQANQQIQREQNPNAASAAQPIRNISTKAPPKQPVVRQPMQSTEAPTFSAVASSIRREDNPKAQSGEKLQAATAKNTSKPVPILRKRVSQGNQSFQVSHNRDQSALDRQAQSRDGSGFMHSKISFHRFPGEGESQYQKQPTQSVSVAPASALDHGHKAFQTGNQSHQGQRDFDFESESDTVNQQFGNHHHTSDRGDMTMEDVPPITQGRETGALTESEQNEAKHQEGDAIRLEFDDLAKAFKQNMLTAHVLLCQVQGELLSIEAGELENLEALEEAENGLDKFCEEFGINVEY